MSESETLELLSSYRFYRNVVESMNTARKYYIYDWETFNELITDYQKKIEFIERLVVSFAPSRIFILIDLHYLKGIPLDKCFECMNISRSTGYRYLKTAIKAVTIKYERIADTLDISLDELVGREKE